MDTYHFENSTLSALIHSSQCKNGTNTDSGYESGTKLGDTVAETDLSSQECVLEQPDPGHSDMLHTTKSEHVQSAVTTFQCNLCPVKFTRAYNLRSHLLIHSGQ